MVEYFLICFLILLCFFFSFFSFVFVCFCCFVARRKVVMFFKSFIFSRVFWICNFCVLINFIEFDDLMIILKLFKLVGILLVINLVFLDIFVFYKFSSFARIYRRLFEVGGMSMLLKFFKCIVLVLRFIDFIWLEYKWY